MVQIFNPQVHSQQAVPFQQLPQQPGYYNNPNEQQDDGQPKNAMDYILGRLGAGGAAGIESGITGGIQTALKRSALDKMLNNLNPNMSPRERLMTVAGADAETQPLLQEFFKQEDARKIQQQQQQAQDALMRSQMPQQPSRSQPIDQMSQMGAEQATGQLPAGQIQGAPNKPVDLTPEENAIFENYANLNPTDKKAANTRLNQIRKEKSELAKESRIREQEERKLAFKETEKFRDEISTERKSYEKNKALIDNMARLDATGKLTNPRAYSLLKKIGMDIPSLLSPESQEYLKFQQSYLTNAKNIFGSQISAFEINEYLKGIPTLENTSEGKKRIFMNQMIENEGRKAIVDATDEVIKENGGTPPLDLETRARERAQPKIAALAEQYKQGISQPVEQKSPVPGRNKASNVTAKPGYQVMTNPQTGQTLQMLESDVAAAKQAGWQ